MDILPAPPNELQVLVVNRIDTGLLVWPGQDGVCWAVTNFDLFRFLFLFWPHHAACVILFPHPGIEPVAPAVEARSPNH